MNETKVVYILGSQRGGTTIVSRMLGTIEGVVHGGELRSFWTAGLKKQICGCGKTYAECEVWSNVLVRLDIADVEEMVRLQRRVAPAGQAWWHARRVLRRDSALDPASPQGRYTAAVARLYRAFALASDAKVVVDSSKHPGEAALLTKAADVSLYCIHVVRDPRGTVYDREIRRSGRLRHRLERVGRSGAENIHPIGTAHTSLAWLGRHMTAEAVRRRIGDVRSLVVRYEDFAADPAATLMAVSELVNLPPRWSPISDDRSVRLPTAHTPAGGGRLLARDVTIAEDTRWRSSLRPFDRVLATALTSPRRRRYGYPRSSSRVDASDRSTEVSR